MLRVSHLLSITESLMIQLEDLRVLILKNRGWRKFAEICWLAMGCIRRLSFLD